MRWAEPLLLSCAEKDHAFGVESRRTALDILEREQKRYHVQLFQGVGHGFAVKGDPKDPYQSESSDCFLDEMRPMVDAIYLGWCKEQSLRGMTDWFTLWLGESS